MAATFDTLKYAEALKAAGVSEAQARAQALALADAFKEGVGELATRQDLTQGLSGVRQEIEALRRDFAVQAERMEGRFRLLYWMVSFALAMLAAVLWMLIRNAT